MHQTDLETIVKKFKEDANPKDRYTSFDYCYNFFLNSKNLNLDIEKSCLTLGFYLASWGMLRGSSFLLQKSVKYFEPTIEYISTLDRSIWSIDIDNYSNENIEIIIEIYREIQERIILNGNSHLTLITKILLGVFGFIPAYDQYFCNKFRDIFKDQNCGFRVVNAKSLNCLQDFYLSNQLIIDKLAEETYTTDFFTGTKTDIRYPKTKIVDMYGFTAGLELERLTTTTPIKSLNPNL